jgi:hypothetical protein
VTPVEGEAGADSDDEALAGDERERRVAGNESEKRQKRTERGQGGEREEREKREMAPGGRSRRGEDDPEAGGGATLAEVDAYGFTLELDAAGSSARARCEATAAKRSPRWDRYRRAGDSAFSDVAHRPDGVLKTLIRKGVPEDLRPSVWMATSGAHAKKKVAPRAYYKRLQALPVDQVQPVYFGPRTLRPSPTLHSYLNLKPITLNHKP